MSKLKFQRDLDSHNKAMREHVEAFQAIYTKCKEEDRNPTPEENEEILEHTKAIELIREEKAEVEESLKTIQHVEDVGRELGPALGDHNGNGIGESNLSRIQMGSTPIDRMVKSLGEQFTESDGFKGAIAGFKGGGQEFRTGPIELRSGAMFKGTLEEGAGAPGTGTGGGLIPVPQVIPGVTETLFQPLRVEQLLLSGQTTTNTLRYVVEGTATNAAAAVAEHGTKPESTLVLSTTDEPVKKVATTLTVSDEMLEDVQQVQSYINGRLSLFVSIQSEKSIVSGAGTNDLVGITSATRACNIYPRGTVDSNAVALFKAMNGQRGSAFLEPDFIVMHPTNWQATRLAVDTANQFFGGGPFLGQYGSGANLPASGQITGVQDMIWNKPVVVTTAVGVGTAIVGTQSAAQVWSRGGLTVEATNSHASNFTANLVAIRAERRLALAIYRPTAFTIVTGLS